jgi:lipoate synthase
VKTERRMLLTAAVINRFVKNSDKQICQKKTKKVQLAKPKYKWKNNIKAVIKRVVLITCCFSNATAKQITECYETGLQRFYSERQF